MNTKLVAIVACTIALSACVDGIRRTEYEDSTSGNMVADIDVSAQISVEETGGTLVATLTFQNNLDRDVCFDADALPLGGMMQRPLYNIRQDRRHAVFSEQQTLPQSENNPALLPRRLAPGDTIVEQTVLDQFYVLPPSFSSPTIRFLTTGIMCGTDVPDIGAADIVYVSSNTIQVSRAY